MTDHAIWNRASLRAQVLRERRDSRVDTALQVSDLRTAWQSLRLEQHVHALPGVDRVSVDMRARRARVTFDPMQTDLEAILDACRAVGCHAQPLPRKQLDDTRRRDADDALKHLLVAGIFAMQAMMFALVLYVSDPDTVDATTFHLFRWLGLLAATPVVTYAAAPFYRRAIADLRRRRPGIDVPVALVVLLAWLASTWNTLAGHGHTWFDSASMLVFVLLLGRYLEQRTRHRQQATTDAETSSVPLTTERHGVDGTRTTVAVAELAPDDCIHVSEGCVIPVDGILVSTDAHLDTALHTGEAQARTAHCGDAIAAGSIPVSGPVDVQVTRTGANSSLQQLHQLTRTAQQAQKADPATPAVVWFIRGILGVALATLGFWLLRDPARAFSATVAVLIVACPCAFGLAAPATLTRAVTLLATRGVRVTRPRALLDLLRIDRALIDKTGTLTSPAVTETPQTWGAWTAAAATTRALALARESAHPLARALAHAHTDMAAPSARNVQVSAGRGITGWIDGRQFFLGQPPTSADIDQDDARLWLSHDKRPVAAFAMPEQPRPGARAAIDTLRNAGISLHLASGDTPTRVQALAEHLDVSAWQARQTPQAKHDRVCQWQQQGHHVLVLGDGSNDAAALAAADVSVSLVAATDLARGQADVLLENGLGRLDLLLAMARDARRTLQQNRAWALVWNTLAIPFAAAGMVPPWLAMLGMSASSLIVVGNVLRMTPPGTNVGSSGQLRERAA